MSYFDDADEATHDTLFSGELHCRQPGQGYRFSVDAVLLAHFITPKKGDRILDLGAGCGVVSLILAYRHPEVAVTAVEIQERLASLAEQNVVLNRLEGRIRVLAGDFGRIGELTTPGSFEWVVCNPPYRRSRSGRQSAGGERAAARHEVMSDLTAVVAAMRFAVKTRGRAALVYPATRGATLMGELKKNGLEPKRLQIVYSYPGSPGKLLLLEAVKGGGEELQVLPPFYIYREPGGAYSEEMARCYQPSHRTGIE